MSAEQGASMRPTIGPDAVVIKRHPPGGQMGPIEITVSPSLHGLHVAVDQGGQEVGPTGLIPWGLIDLMRKEHQ